MRKAPALKVDSFGHKCDCIRRTSQGLAGDFLRQMSLQVTREAHLSLSAPGCSVRDFSDVPNPGVRMEHTHRGLRTRGLPGRQCTCPQHEQSENQLTPLGVTFPVIQILQTARPAWMQTQATGQQTESIVSFTMKLTRVPSARAHVAPADLLQSILFLSPNHIRSTHVGKVGEPLEPRCSIFGGLVTSPKIWRKL